MSSMKIPFPHTISFSNFRNYVSCPRRFFGESIYLEKKKQYSIDLLIGVGQHKALSEYFNRKKTGSFLLEKTYEKIISEEIDKNVKNAQRSGFEFKEEEINYSKRVATDMIIRNTINFPFIFGEYFDIFGTEVELLCPIEKHENYNFLGYIDLVTVSNDIYFLWDYKTVKQFWDTSKKRNLEQYTSQLLLYKYFFSKQFHIEPERIRTIYVFFKKTNFVVEKWCSLYTKEDLNIILQRIGDLCVSLNSGIFPVSENVNDSVCQFCQFYNKQKVQCTIAFINTKSYIEEHYTRENAGKFLDKERESFDSF